MENKQAEQIIKSPFKTSKLQDNFLKGTHIDIFGDDYSTEIHAGKYFIHCYNELPYIYAINTDINLESFISSINQLFNLTDKNYILKYEQAHSTDFTKIDKSASEYMILFKEKVILEVQDHRVVFWYGRDIKQAELIEVFQLIKQNEKKKEHSQKFYMIASSPHSEFGFFLQEFDVKKVNVMIAENYNNDFAEVDNIISEFIRCDNKNGVILLHGKYGTGKTTYLRNLISNTNKRFIFLPLNLVEAISSPNFLPFISQYKESVLILEDCEELLSARDSGTGQHNSLVNLLNLGDGLLSDAFSIKIICTFNASLRQIDPAILRKGRLIARYEFTELSVEKASAIAEKLNLNIKIEKPMTLAEIFNSEAINFGEPENRKKIGF